MWGKEKHARVHPLGACFCIVGAKTALGSTNGFRAQVLCSTPWFTFTFDFGQDAFKLPHSCINPEHMISGDMSARTATSSEEAVDFARDKDHLHHVLTTIFAKRSPYFQSAPFLLLPCLLRKMVMGTSPTRIPFFTASMISSLV